MAKHSKTLRRGRGRSRSHISRRQKGGIDAPLPQGGRSRRQKGGVPGERQMPNGGRSRRQRGGMPYRGRA